MVNECFIKAENENTLTLPIWKEMNPSIVVGFTTKKGGKSSGPYQSFNLGLHVNDDKADVLANRFTLADETQFSIDQWVCSEQTHKNKIAKITRLHSGSGTKSMNTAIRDTDGLYTSEPNLLLALCYADCVPLYFYSHKKKLIGTAHAGWKGTVSDIGGNMVRKWVLEEGVEKNDIYVAVGPSIGSCCYVVDDYVINRVTPLLTLDDSKPFTEIAQNQYRLDLKQLNELLLIKAGVKKEHIVISSYCTSCETELFFSHRRDQGQTGRMMSFIGLKED